MSNFLDNSNTSTTSSNPNFAQSPLDFQPTAREIALREWLLRDVLTTPAYKDFAGWVNGRILVDGSEIPISQISGFSGFTAQAATPVITSEGTTSTTFTNLATTGPELTGLADGQYVFIFGCSSVNSGAATAQMSLSYNGAAPSGSDSADNSVNVFSGTARAVTKTLSNGGNNTVTCKYMSSSGASTATFYNRWLVGIKFANA